MNGPLWVFLVSLVASGFSIPVRKARNDSGICAGRENFDRIASDESCLKYIQCYSGNAYLMLCPDDSWFNDAEQICDVNPPPEDCELNSAPPNTEPDFSEEEEAPEGPEEEPQPEGEGEPEQEPQPEGEGESDDAPQPEGEGEAEEEPQPGGDGEPEEEPELPEEQPVEPVDPENPVEVPEEEGNENETPEAEEIVELEPDFPEEEGSGDPTAKPEDIAEASGDNSLEESSEAGEEGSGDEFDLNPNLKAQEQDLGKIILFRPLEINMPADFSIEAVEHDLSEPNFEDEQLMDANSAYHMHFEGIIDDALEAHSKEAEYPLEAPDASTLVRLNTPIY